jgi:hypothetical protein
MNDDQIEVAATIKITPSVWPEGKDLFRVNCFDEKSGREFDKIVDVQVNDWDGFMELSPGLRPTLAIPRSVAVYAVDQSLAPPLTAYIGAPSQRDSVNSFRPAGARVPELATGSKRYFKSWFLPKRTPRLARTAFNSFSAAC